MGPSEHTNLGMARNYWGPPPTWTWRPSLSAVVMLPWDHSTLFVVLGLALSLKDATFYYANHSLGLDQGPYRGAVAWQLDLGAT
ncbi:hypothetical protein NL676_038521 [Syzygium grande]|nr:hypothetical protein NL676_038521 [Syzygium grande]